MLTTEVSGSRITLRILLGQVIRYIPGGIIPAAISVVSSAVFTRLISTDDFGNYSLVLSVSGLLTAISSRWLEQSVGRFLPETLVESEVAVRKRTMFQGLIYVLAATLGGILAVMGLFGAAFSRSTWQLVVPASLLTAATAVYGPLLVVLQVEMKAHKYSLYQMAQSLLRFVLCYLVMVYVSPSSGGILWGIALSYVVLVPFIFRDAQLAATLKVPPNSRELKKYLAFGLPLVGWFLAANVLSVGDRWIVGLFRGASEVGIYSANYNLISGAASLAGAPLLLAVHPLLMRTWGAGEAEQAAQWLGRMMEWFCLISAFVIGVAYLYSGDVALLLLGPGYRSGHAIMPIVLAGVLAWQLGMYAHKPLEFHGKTRMMLYLALLAGALNFGLNLILVPVFGYPAAAWATLISYLFYVVAAMYFGHRMLRWRFHHLRLDLEVMGIIACGIVMSGVLRNFIEGAWGYLAGLGVCSGTVILTAIGATIWYLHRSKILV